MTRSIADQVVTLHDANSDGAVVGRALWGVCTLTGVIDDHGRDIEWLTP